ncbi:hypothetical protein J4410_03275 [Candidatus Woesearchaeota archaeon]|nr:hypothetical protein [Candidatus Woesearchaeota archaeon]
MEFHTAPYTTPYTPMERGYYEPPKDSVSIEEPIVSISSIGQTVPEKDPRTGAHIIQTTQAAIRAGASRIQWVQTTPSTNPIGGRVKSYGKDAREALRELIKVNEVQVAGWEMPTSSITNLSGYNPQSGNISEEKRHEDMNEVRDAIRFVGEVSNGGGVDIWSQEFPRTMFDAPFNRSKEAAKGWTFKAYDLENNMAVKHLVDDRSGRIIQEIRMNQEINYPEWSRYNEKNKKVWEKYEGRPYHDEKGNLVKPHEYIDYEGNKVERKERVALYDFDRHTLVIQKRTWKDFEDEAREINEERARKKGIPVHMLPEDDRATPQEAFIFASTESQQAIAEAYGREYQSNIEEANRLLEKLKEAKKYYEQIEASVGHDKEALMRLKSEDKIKRYNEFITPDFRLPTEIIEEEIRGTRDRVRFSRDMAMGQFQSAKDLEIQRQHIQTAERYAKNRTVESYAELGIYAMQESKAMKTERPVHVGPEIGWPGAWGGHPEEFVDLVKTSRQKMIDLLTSPQITDGKEKGKANPYFDPGISKKQAEEYANTHIRGVWDASHQGMWLNYFRRKPGESEDERLQEFNKWYLEQVNKIIQEDVVGDIQAVDSASGAHGHLPAGQGIFPVVEAVKRFREAGWDGSVLSEGHEEEQFGQSRILIETWKAFGAGIGTPGYHSVVPGGPMGGPTWGSVQHAYFGQAHTPYFVFGAYAPSNDWSLWSQVQLE